MTVSLLLRLVEAALASGRLAGEAVLVETGERAVVRDAQEIVEFVRGGSKEPAVDEGGCGDEPEA
jgi:hypothetical protein